MRLVGHRDEVFAWETAEVAHDILALRAAVREFQRLIAQRVEKLVDFSKRWIQQTRVATG
ncbi:hypothetical protein GJ744_000945 [Endocarpon pusillum]|uniref:Uncharacterized protein n=1 Tax=Endocarpon pusillum TaxID=364733 RepID=A0A8H7ADB6_9EURO|nr:hypothetical protein GJ744_000945 [Endocarpon pusillum]